MDTRYEDNEDTRSKKSRLRFWFTKDGGGFEAEADSAAIDYAVRVLSKAGALCLVALGAAVVAGAGAIAVAQTRQS